MLDARSIGLEDYELDMPDETDKPSPLVEMMIAQALTNQKVEEVGRLVNELRGEVRELKTTFATKAELAHLADDVKSLKDWNQWVLRAIVGLIITGIIGTVLIKGGVPRP